MSDQLREWLQSHHKVCSSQTFFDKAKVISVSSGKGGVGKTSISLKMGKLLAGKGKRVLLIDCDYNLSNTFVKLGIPLQENFSKFIKNLKDFEDCLYVDGNIHILAGCNGDLDLVENEIKMDHFYINLISRVERKYDYIILDTPAGMSKDLMSLNAYADQRVFVVTPDSASITDSYSCIKVLKNKYGVRENLLVVNNFRTGQEYKRIVKVLSETVENFLSSRLIVLGGVRKSEKLGEQFDRELLWEEKSALHKDCSKLVKRLAELVGDPESPEASASEKLNYGANICEHEVHRTT